MSFVQVSALSKSYQVGNEPLRVLRDLNLTVSKGEMVAVIGASGVGKSTLMHVLGGLDRIESGTIRIGETTITDLSEAELVAFRNRSVGFVFQFHHLLPEFSALENTEMPLWISRVSSKDSKPSAEMLLSQVGLGDRLHHDPSMLSGGEQQRVAIARALIMRPRLLLADEPTGDLDEHTAESLHDLIREMHRENDLTSIIATHNLRLASACDRILRLEDGQLAAE